MRPIDADVLIEVIDKIDWYSFHNGYLINGAECEEKALYKANEIITAITNAPTLGYKDLVPQGEWVVPVTGEPWRGGYFGKCSNCKEIHHNTEMMPPYCPRCGARMKGGK